MEFDRFGCLAFNLLATKLTLPVLDELARGVHLILADGLGEVDRPFWEMLAYDTVVEHTIDQHLEYYDGSEPLRARGSTSRSTRC